MWVKNEYTVLLKIQKHSNFNNLVVLSRVVTRTPALYTRTFRIYQ